MLNVGLLTTHACMNYGGVLQAFALQNTIESLGHICTIINYKPEMHNIREHPMQFITQRKDAFAKVFLSISHFQQLKRRLELFDTFRIKRLKVEPSTTVTKNDIAVEALKYDVICCGSDQLWNLGQKDNQDCAYMLDFPKKEYRFSYAVSFGDGLHVCKNRIMQSLPLLQKFDRISVREPGGQAFLKEHGVDATITIDPTLLADISLWDRLPDHDLIGKPYILVYGFENAYQCYEDLITVTRRASRELGLKVINPVMAPPLVKAGFNSYFGCGPEEFLNLVRHAKLICTNSFHGSVFSFLMQRPFLCVFGKGGAKEVRKANFLSTLELEHRAVSVDDAFDMDILLRKDDARSYEHLELNRQNSLRWLRETLGRLEGA